MFLGRRYSLPQATVKMAVGQGITTSKHLADCDAGQYKYWRTQYSETEFPRSLSDFEDSSKTF